MAGERYGLYGVIAQEHEANKPEDFAKQQAEDTGGLLIYETDDRDEAKRIYVAGGFERDGQWHVVTRVEDRTKDMTIRQTHRMPDKRDYDQS